MKHLNSLPANVNFLYTHVGDIWTCRVYQNRSKSLILVHEDSNGDKSIILYTKSDLKHLSQTISNLVDHGYQTTIPEELPKES